MPGSEPLPEFDAPLHHPPGPPLASGREADVYAWGEDRVLRRYRHGGDVAAEAAVMAYVRRHGFPAPEVFHAAGPDLVLERVPGPTLGESALGGDTSLVAAAELLAWLHAGLHAVPPRDAPDRPGTRSLHLDLHPENVILSPRGPVLLDWRNATEGPPDLDLALTAVILAEVAGDSYAPPEVAAAAPELLAAFLERAGGNPLSQLEPALARRSVDPSLSAEERARLHAIPAMVRAHMPALPDPTGVAG